ncbi:nucleoside diphosphate-linked moiety X motif 19 [Protopterus annectens]|uniref:nucleoside diphosphate-linked moiety X motif 19 n=1 Tax=Protopterus annectens TaxID=7888 RepID=UPI001CFB3BB9|nr:nucleoside diphosphate-linked moiety X motif 19 [Protopterus annectens]
MNTTLRYWKEAATLILLAGVKNKHTNSLLKKQQTIHLIESCSHSEVFDYKTLLLQRSQQSGFMPNAYVFPGGLFESCDFSTDWLDVFRSFSELPNFGLGVVMQPLSSRPPIFATDRKKFGSAVPGEVAFRICAIRETFEEAGILIAVPSSNNKAYDGGIAKLIAYDPSELAVWRQRVQNDPTNFARMCKELNCMPNIWALYEWSNWLTPSTSPNSRRYDTAFFTCCVEELPYTFHDDKEISHFKWSSPVDALTSFRNKEIWIAPPQFYEMSRLCHFSSLSNLHHFCQQRSLEGCERWMAHIIKTSDGFFHILPGDELYSEDPNFTGEQLKMTTEKTSEELLNISKKIHRIGVQGLHNFVIHVNIEPKYKHFHPITRNNSETSENNVLHSSKL